MRPASIAPKRRRPVPAPAPEPVEEARKSPSHGPEYVAWTASAVMLIAALILIYLVAVSV